MDGMEMEEGRTAVYAGSFNPIHEGHMAIIEKLSRDFPKVLVVVSVQNPFKDVSSYEEYDRRFENVCRKCRERGMPGFVGVSSVEKNLTPPYYYINTIRELERLEEGTMVPVFGADCLEEFDRWKDWDSILSGHEVCIVPRKGYDGPALLQALRDRHPDLASGWNIRFLDYDVPKISSTEIRNLEK